jgi:hypothetical protein
MQRFTQLFLVAVLASAACKADPGISNTNPGNGGGGPGGGSGGAGSGGSGGGGVSPDANFVFPGADATNKPPPVSIDASCGYQKYKLERLPPELMLVLDRSSSMLAAVPGSTNNRWVETTTAIRDILTQTEGKIFWGLKNFPTPAGCMVLPNVEVPVGMSGTPVANNIAMTMPNSPAFPGTPTSLAIDISTTYMRTLTSKNPKYLVLATDGEPSCPQGAGQAEVEAMTIGSITGAKAAGFDTFVVGIATAGTNADKVLNDMATAGGRPRAAMPLYYPVANRKDLVDALTQITQVVASCTFNLDKDPPSPNDVAVNLDGRRIMRDPGQTEGWNYGAGNRSIILYGSVCEMLKMGKVNDVEIIFGCPNVPIP